MSLQILSHEALHPVQHGFFTRKGGASSGIFAGLNGGEGSSDQSEAVAVNRARMAEALDLAPGALRSVHQCHSARVIHMNGAVPQTPRPRADAMVTATPGIGLVILTADCQPVLFADREAGVIGAAHAGWKGAIGGVLEATIVAMEELGARREAIAAVIGPSISQRNYEVGPEFLESFLQEDEDSGRFFAQGSGDRLLFDLPGYGLHRLRRAGIADAQWTRHCTYADAENFYSFRRATHAGEADYGRLMSAIRL